MVKNYLRFAGVALVALALIALSRSGASKAQHNATESYAITNARIVTVAGPTIEKGTVVIRDGLILSVGTNVTAPADARTIDGAGLTVYPGLIDASTNLGMPQPSPTPGVGGGRGGGGGQFQFPGGQSPMASALNSTQPAGLQPEIMAADYLRPGGDQIEAERTAGITTALTAPRAGIFIGQSALINLAGNTPQEMIVRSPVALQVGFTPLRGGGYPGSLMGVFSAIRQMLLDAQRYQETQKIYARSPRGVRRPEQDKSLEALLPVLNRELPVVMHADRERDISRAIDLAIEALTITAAEILNDDDGLGSIGTGKVADLTVTRGNVLDRTVRVAYEFIDGRHIDLLPGAAPASASPAPSASPKPEAS